MEFLGSFVRFVYRYVQRLATLHAGLKNWENLTETICSPFLAAVETQAAAYSPVSLKPNKLFYPVRPCFNIVWHLYFKGHFSRTRESEYKNKFSLQCAPRISLHPAPASTARSAARGCDIRGLRAKIRNTSSFFFSYLPLP